MQGKRWVAMAMLSVSFHDLHLVEMTKVPLQQQHPSLLWVVGVIVLTCCALVFTFEGA